jgi:hypothetical protein
VERSGSGRPSKMVPYLPQVARWLRADPNLPSAEILRRVRVAGYSGGKSSLYQLVSRLRMPGSGYRRCPRCRALLRDVAEVCPHCRLSLPSTVAHPPALEDAAPRATGEDMEATARRHASPVPTGEEYLVIAAADRQELYEYFNRTLGGAAAIQVVRDRRMTDRRTREATVPVDRRHRDRRSRPVLDADLSGFGFAIVTRS